MAKEIERKFVVRNDDWRDGSEGLFCRQGYLATSGASASSSGATIRVRVIGEQGFLTIKGKQQGITRSEYEYPIPLEDANAMLDEFCPWPLVEKVRYEREYDGLTWEIDEFLGENDGLIVAEIEMEHADQAVSLPDWLGQEVSEDPRYRNASLAKQPYSQWGRRAS
jgi:CYTH domain-containing protein